VRKKPVALKSTVVKAELQVSDMDRRYYGLHTLTVAQHPSETDERLMVRLLAFGLLADDEGSLAFGKGLSSDDEPDLWRKDLVGDIQLWVELGNPDEQRLRRASGRSRQVVVYSYGGRGAQVWYEKNAGALAKIKNLTVIDLDGGAEALAALYQKSMQLQLLIQDGLVQLMGGEHILDVPMTRRLG
jgi:uncharacterized protein YaeQ